MRRDPRIVIPSCKTLSEDVLPTMLERTLNQVVRPYIDACCTITATFDLWMSKGAQDTFCLVINFLTTDWEPKHIIVGFFEAHDTTGAGLAIQLRVLLEKFGLTKKVICYVKDEGTNLSTMTEALKSVVGCDELGLAAPFEGSCFGHAMSKACQYATADDKVCDNLTPISVKATQSTIQACITWPKKSGKGRQEWAKACMDSSFRPQKLNTPVKTRFASKVLMFQQALQFRSAMSLCYNRQSVTLQNRVPLGQIWAIAEAISTTLSP